MIDEADHATFRAEIREFATSHCPSDIVAVVAQGQKLTREPWSRWQRILYENGWGAPGWPAEYGGTGWNPRQQAIFDEVIAECDCPPQYHHGLRHIGPVIIEYGTRGQKLKFLPGILSGEDWWCQGYSEPGAGSDLASLRTRAARNGDVYIVNGQKTWTSHAHEADMMYTLVRTSNEPKKQQGISLLLISMRSKGVTVRPIHTIDGWYHVNEVFLDNVEVPIDNLIGNEGMGWEYAKFLLQRERLSAANTAPLSRLLEKARRLITSQLAGPTTTRRREALELRLLHLEAEIACQRELSLRAIDDEMHHRPLGLTPSVLKIASSRLFQELSEIFLEVQGLVPGPRVPVSCDVISNGDSYGTEWLQNYFFMRSRTIVGGTDEVQKNIVSRVLFGD